MFKKLLISAVLSLSLLTGCSTINKFEYSAELGQVVDSATTVTFLNMGIQEANPIVASNLWILAVKPFVPTLFRYLIKDKESCAALNQYMGHLGYGAAGWNLGVMFAGGGPAAVAIAIATVPLTMYWLRETSLKACDKP